MLPRTIKVLLDALLQGSGLCEDLTWGYSNIQQDRSHSPVNQIVATSISTLGSSLTAGDVDLADIKVFKPRARDVSSVCTNMILELGFTGRMARIMSSHSLTDYISSRASVNLPSIHP